MEKEKEVVVEDKKKLAKLGEKLEKEDFPGVVEVIEELEGKE